MKFQEARKLEDCFDGSQAFSYTFDEPWTEENILELASFGTLEYFPEFPRPFFRLRTARGLEVKGVGGDTQCRVIFPRTDGEEVRRDFEKHFS